MHKRLKRKKRLFILLQFLALLGIVIFNVFILLKNSLETSSAINKDKLSKTVELVTNYLYLNPTLPRDQIDPNIMVFALDQRDGSYVFERTDRVRKKNNLWEQYRSKLTYQMQKQNIGWILYPERQWWNIFDTSRIIRFSTMEGKQWIVAAETHLPTNWSLVQGIIDEKNLADLFLIALIVFIILKLITDGYFYKLAKQYTDSYDDSLLQFGHTVIKSNPIAPELKKRVPRRETKPEPKQVESLPEESNVGNLPEHNLDVPIEDESSVQNDAIDEEPERETEENYSDPRLNQPAEVSQQKELEPEQSHHAFKSADSSDKLTLQISEIKSPVLIELLKELRGNNA